ncbi:hypothetical protein GCM10010483_59010 [Actinokineospora diospyrosa]
MVAPLDTTVHSSLGHRCTLKEAVTGKDISGGERCLVGTAGAALLAGSRWACWELRGVRRSYSCHRAFPPW